jgi:hypothetical protein
LHGGMDVWHRGVAHGTPLVRASLRSIDNIKVYRVPSPHGNSSKVGGVYAKL